jgi:hypothetical protein
LVNEQNDIRRRHNMACPYLCDRRRRRAQGPLRFRLVFIGAFLSPLVAGILLAVLPDLYMRGLLEEPRRSAAVDDRALLRNIQQGAGSINGLLPPVIFIGALVVVLGVVWIGWSKGFFTASKQNVPPITQAGTTPPSQAKKPDTQPARVAPASPGKQNVTR